MTIAEQVAQEFNRVADIAPSRLAALFGPIDGDSMSMSEEGQTALVLLYEIGGRGNLLLDRENGLQMKVQ